jgi:Arc/MetJ-type ribon-helix-helix transcriptional regulator
MAKLISDKPKNGKRGRPATGKDPMIGLRAPPPLIRKIDAWAAANSVTSRSDAIRRLVEHGLSSELEVTKRRRLAPDQNGKATGRSIREARVALEQTRAKIELALAAIARAEATSSSGFAGEADAAKPRPTAKPK